MCLATIGVLLGSTACANATPLNTTAQAPTQHIQQLRATPTEAANLPQVLQAAAYSPVLHRVSAFLLRTPMCNYSASKLIFSHCTYAVTAQLHQQAVPLHLAIRVLLI